MYNRRYKKRPGEQTLKKNGVMVTPHQPKLQNL